MIVSLNIAYSADLGKFVIKPCAELQAYRYPNKKQENRNHPFSLHEVLYIQRRRILGYIALLKAVVPVKIEHASAVVSAHGGEMTVFEYERRAVLGSDA